jgi:Putative adhesin
MKKLFLLLCVAALALAADRGRYREDFHYSYPQTAGGRLNVDNFNGSVEITGWDRNTVDISGTKYASSQDLLNAIKIEVSSSGNAVQVRAIRPGGVHRGSIGAKYTIRVPRGTTLESVASSNGSVRVEDVEGETHLTTSNGSVHLARIRGNVDAHTSNGSVEVNDVNGRMTFRTSNGSVHAENAHGALQAETSNGGVHVHLADSEAGQVIHLATSNGPIDLQLDSPRSNDVLAKTSNGSVTLRMPGGAGAALHAATSSSGSIRSDFEILTHGQLSPSHIDGTIGSGGARIDLTTSNGNIRLLKI